MIFLKFFTSTQLFAEFLENFIQNKNEKTISFVLKYTKLSKEKYHKQILKEVQKEHLKNKLIDFHYVTIDK